MDKSEETSEALLSRRVAAFESFRTERFPILHQFFQSLGFEQPHEVLNTPEKFLAPLDNGLRHSVISEENRVWFITRLGYYVGEYLVVVYDGLWLVDKNPASPTFAQHVVSDFSVDGVATDTVDPFSVAQRDADTPAPRFLADEIKKVAAL